MSPGDPVSLTEHHLHVHSVLGWAVDHVRFCPDCIQDVPDATDALLCGECGIVLLRTSDLFRDATGLLLICMNCGALNIESCSTPAMRLLPLQRHYPDRAHLRLVPPSAGARAVDATSAEASTPPGVERAHRALVLLTRDDSAPSTRNTDDEAL